MPEFPWAAFLEAVKTKNQNRQQMMDQFGQSLAGLGQNIGQGVQQRRQAQAQSQFGQELSNLSKPVQGPMTAGGQMPQQPPPDIGKLFGMAGKAYPGQEGSMMPGILEMLRGKKQTPEYAPLPGFLSGGHPVLYDKFDPSKTTMLPIQGTSTGGTAMAGVRERQFTLQDLPSNQGPTTAGGAAYQVKVAARQGKNLIAKSGSSQRIGLASGDLARSVLRAAPTDEAMRNSNFSDNVINRWNEIKQKITSDPSAINNPAIRREMYNIFDEMDKSATPFIENQLNDMESVGFKISPAVRKRQLGLTLPDIPFIEFDSKPGGGKDLSGMSQSDLERIAGGK